MIDATPLVRCYARFRARRLARQDAVSIQRQILKRLIERAAATRFGRDHDFARLRDRRDFSAAVPLRCYENFWSAYWQPAFPNLIDCSWPGRVPFFAATSGTSSGATKFIPLTWESVRSNRRAGLDLLGHHLRQRPHSHVFAGRHLLLGGSTALTERAPGVESGDLTGIAAASLPAWARRFAFPPPEIARLTDWSAKMALLAERAPAAAPAASASCHRRSACSGRAGLPSGCGGAAGSAARTRCRGSSSIPNCSPTSGRSRR